MSRHRFFEGAKTAIARGGAHCQRAGVAKGRGRACRFRFRLRQALAPEACLESWSDERQVRRPCRDRGGAFKNICFQNEAGIRAGFCAMDDLAGADQEACITNATAEESRAQRCASTLSFFFFLPFSGKFRKILRGGLFVGCAPFGFEKSAQLHPVGSAG